MEFTEQELRVLRVKNKHELALMLDKGLYGLKQSGRLWNHLLHKVLVSVGFLQCYTDSCLYVKSEVDGITLVGIYVDDILMTATSAKKVDKFFLDMQIVELKDLRIVSKFLGIVLTHYEERGWVLDQDQAIQDLLVKFQLDKAAPKENTTQDGVLVEAFSDVDYAGDRVIGSR
ncbi:Pol Polyprotein [Phytophthora megakarya]|uniref:Pol Polyprotein n=1 Tax=Phytophthora megakarya TaxID=4795 RepID=A0A225X3H5_9STRA|nr:Pol Polyprotein [Phytophthora megakarya]